MKALLFGKALVRGVSTLEILVACALLMLSITAAIVMEFGSQSLVIDTQIHSDALARVMQSLEAVRAVSRQDFNAAVSTSSVWVKGARVYAQVLTVTDQTQCRKQASSSISWENSPAQFKTVEIASILTDVKTALALGGDCIAEPPSASWDIPREFADGLLPGGAPTAIDEINRTLYGGMNVAPYFFIVDTGALGSDATGDTFVAFTNGFAMYAPINALDAIVWRNVAGTSKQYVFAAMAATTSQVAVIEVTDPHNPKRIAVRTLNNVSPTGSEPAGYRLYYYGDRLYVLTKYTAGPELHIFDVSDPTNPLELGNGVELGVTANNIVVQERFIAGMRKRFAYFATDQLSGELKVYDVTDPGGLGVATEVLAARQDLPGAQNGLSVYLLGDLLYFGRASTPTGPDLYVFDTSNPIRGLERVAAQDIGTGVSAIIVAGKFAFMLTPKSKKEFQVWDVSANPMSLISTHPLLSASVGGFDYASGFIYATRQGSRSLEVLTQ